MIERGSFVVVTTEHRGVFSGYLAEVKAPESLILMDARHCVYWDASVRGVLGLAADGPGPGCRVSRKAPEIALWKITGIFLCSEKAQKAWEAEPWKS